MASKLFKIVWGLVFAALALLNLFLISQNKVLKDRVELAVHGDLHPGGTLHPFAGINLRREYVEVLFDLEQKPAIFISFSAACAACQDSLDYWRVLDDQLSRSDWRVYWLSRDGIAAATAFAAENQLEGQVLSEFSCPTVNALALRSVPSIIATDAGGTISRVWHGQITESSWAEISNFLDMAHSSEAKTAQGLPPTSE